MNRYFTSTKNLKWIFLFFMMTCFFAVSSHAFNVKYSGVQFRNYTDSSNSHIRAYFGLEKDGSFEYGNISYTVASPDFDVVTSGSWSDCEMYNIGGSYDETQGLTFGSFEPLGCYFRATIDNDPGTGGTYVITIKDEASQAEVTKEVVFNPGNDPGTGKYIIPPFVDSNSFKFSMDTLNNEQALRMEWGLPDDMGDNTLYLSIASQNNWRQFFGVALPNTLNTILIPLGLFEKFADQNKFKFTMQSRSASGEVRSYSNSVSVNLAKLISPNAKPTVTAAFPFTGTGFLKLDNYTENQSTIQQVDIQGTVSLLSNYGETCWNVDVTIPGMDPLTIVLQDNNGNCYEPFIDTELVNLETGSCWGGNCPEDSSKPGEIGHQNMFMALKLTDFTGLLSITASSNKSATGGTDSHLQFIGNVKLTIDQ